MRAAEAEELRVIANGLTSRKSRVIPKPNEHDEKPHAHGEQRQSDAESFRRIDKLERASPRRRFESDEHAAQLHARPPSPPPTHSRSRFHSAGRRCARGGSREADEAEARERS